jgi:predicted nucleic acid-binding protein
MGVAEFRQALSAHGLVAIDTMIFLYLLDEHPRYVDCAMTLFEAIEQGQLRGVTSTLTLAELLTAPAQQANLQALRDYELYLTNFPNLQLAPFEAEVARATATVRATTRLRLPDALQIATAQVAGAHAIIGNDHQWRNKFREPALLLLDDFL